MPSSGVLRLVPLFACLAAIVAAQEPAAITLLLRAPHTLEPGVVRQALARVLGTEVAERAPAGGDAPWLADAGDGGCAGVRWRLAFAAKPLQLGEAALANLEDDGRQALEAHAAHVVVAALVAAKDDAGRRADYRALAAVARALLRRDVVGKDALGIGCRDHGTFEVVDARTIKQLAGDDPLAALEPVASTSLVVLMKQPFELVEAKLIAVVQQELHVAIPADAGQQAQEFVAVAGHGTRAMLKVGGQPVMLTMRKERAFPTPPRLELRLRNLVDAHTAVLQLVAFGAPGDAAARARARVLGRLAAGLWNDDCLVVNWSTDAALIARSEELPQQLRAEDPIGATSRGGPVPVIEVGTDDPAMAAAIAEARRRFGEAEAFFRGGGKLFVKFPFATRKGGPEHIWVEVSSIADGVVKGKLGNAPLDVEGLREGSAVECKVAELSDWVFERDGARVGGFSLKVLEEAAKKTRGR